MKLACSTVVACAWACGGHKEADREPPREAPVHFTGTLGELPVAIDLPATWQVWETRPETCKPHPATGCSDITWSPPTARHSGPGEGPEVRVFIDAFPPATAAQALARAIKSEAEQTEGAHDLPDGYSFVTRTQDQHLWRIRFGRHKPKADVGIACEGLAVDDRAPLGDDVRQQLETICSSLRLP